MVTLEFQHWSELAGQFDWEVEVTFKINRENINHPYTRLQEALKLTTISSVSAIKFLALLVPSPYLSAADWTGCDQLTPPQPIHGLARSLYNKDELGHQIPSSGI